MTQSLRSSPLSRAVLTTTNCSAPVPHIGPRHLTRSTRLEPSLGIATTGSHVPHKSLMQSHATSVPDAAWPRNRVFATLNLGAANLLQFRHHLKQLFRQV